MQAAPPIALRPFMLLSSASRCSTSLSPLSTSPMVKSTLAVLGRRTLATKTSAPVSIASRLCTCSASNKRTFSTSHDSSEQERTLASRSATAPRLTEQLQVSSSTSVIIYIQSDAFALYSPASQELPQPSSSDYALCTSPPQPGRCPQQLPHCLLMQHRENTRIHQSRSWFSRRPMSPAICFWLPVSSSRLSLLAA